MTQEATANEPIVTSNNLEAVSDENPREQAVKEKQPTAEQGDDKTNESEKKPENDPTSEDKEDRKNRRRERNNRRATRHIQKIEAEKQQLREQLAYERGRREALERGQQDDATPPRPAREDYETEDDYLDAVLDWRDETKKASETNDETRSANKDSTETQQSDQPAIADADDIKSYMENGRDRFGEDFDDMMEAAENSEFAVSPMMAQAIFESAQGPDIAMHLYNNPEQADKIAGLPGARQVREILKLEAKFSDGQPVGEPTDNKPPKKVTNAPPPGEPESGTDMHEVDPNKMGMEEYARYRQKQRGEIK